MRILLFIGTFIAIFFIYHLSLQQPTSEKPIKKEQDSLPVAAIDTPTIVEELPSEPWAYDSLAIHQQIEALSKQEDEKISAKAVNQLIRLFCDKPYKQKEVATLNNFFVFANMDNESSNELILHLDDIYDSKGYYSTIYVFDKGRDSIWKMKQEMIYVAGQKTCKVYPNYKNIVFSSKTGVVESDFYTYNGTLLLQTLYLLGQQNFFWPEYLVDIEIKQIDKNRLEAIYKPILPEYDLKLGNFNVLYERNPKTLLYVQKTKLPLAKQNALVWMGESLRTTLAGSVRSEKAFCAFQKELAVLRKSGSPEEKQAVDAFFKTMKENGLSCK